MKASQPLPCENCGGRGLVEELINQGHENSAGHPIPGYIDTVCSECRGFKYEKCEYFLLCGNPATVQYHEFVVCDGCLEEIGEDG